MYTVYIHVHCSYIYNIHLLVHVHVGEHDCGVAVTERHVTFHELIEIFSQVFKIHVHMYK